MKLHPPSAVAVFGVDHAVLAGSATMPPIQHGNEQAHAGMNQVRIGDNSTVNLANLLAMDSRPVELAENERKRVALAQYLERVMNFKG